MRDARGDELDRATRRTSWSESFALDPITSAIVALVITGAIAFRVGILIVRMTGAGATFAILVIVHSIFLYRTKLFKGIRCFLHPADVVIDVYCDFDGGSRLHRARISRKPWGVMLRASADDETGSAAMGVNVVRLRLSALWLDPCGGGIAYAYYLGTISALP